MNYVKLHELADKALERLASIGGIGGIGSKYACAEGDEIEALKAIVAAAIAAGKPVVGALPQLQPHRYHVAPSAPLGPSGPMVKHTISVVDAASFASSYEQVHGGIVRAQAEAQGQQL